MTSWFKRHAESVPLARRLRIAKLQKLAFGKSSEKIEREIPFRDIVAQCPAGQWSSWNWRWKTCWLPCPKTMMRLSTKVRMNRSQRLPMRPPCVAARVSRRELCASVVNWTPAPAALTVPLGILLCNTLPGSGRRSSRCDLGRAFGTTGEDVSELLDMIAAQMKVICYPAVAACSDERADRPDQEILPPL